MTYGKQKLHAIVNPWKVKQQLFCQVKQVVSTTFKAPLWCWKKGCLLITKIKANTVNTYLLCEILKTSIGNMLNSMKESPNFYPF